MSSSLGDDLQYAVNHAICYVIGGYPTSKETLMMINGKVRCVISCKSDSGNPVILSNEEGSESYWEAWLEAEQYLDRLKDFVDYGLSGVRYENWYFRGMFHAS